MDAEILTEGSLAWLLALSVAILVTIAVKFVIGFAVRRLTALAARTALKWDDIFASCLSQTRSWFVFALVFPPLAIAIDGSEGVKNVARFIVVAATCVQMIIWGLRGAREWKSRILVHKVEKNGSSAAALGLIYSFTQGFLVVCVILIGLSNLGVDIGALLTGLGIGGIAVALAAQNVLGDLLASLSIVLDKPFVIGDFIIAGNELGTVEDIGVKTTRVRSLSGEELIFSNKDLLESRVRNFKRMWQRRAVQTFSVSAETPIEKLREIPAWVRESVQRRPRLRFDRCHFTGVGESAMNFEFVFWIQDPDYNAYMDLQQDLLLEILERFEREKITFGFPIRSIRLDHDGAPRLASFPAEFRENRPLL